MEKAHSNINWVDFPNISTPLASRILNKQDHEIDEIDNRVVEMDTTKAKESDRLLMISDVDLNMENGVLTVTRANGTKKTYDTALEKIAVNFRFDYATQALIIELPDGNQIIDMSALITQYEFSSTSTISFNVGSDGKVSAFIPNGAVKKENLDTDYLVEIEGQVNMAESYAEQSQNSANASSSASVLAEEYAEQARIYKDQAFSGTPQGYEALVVDVSNLESSVNLEKTQRENSDTAINNRIDNLIVGAGGDSPIEVTDAHVGTDGKTYPTLKARLDSENYQLSESIVKNYSELKADLAGLSFSINSDDGGLDIVIKEE